MRKRWKSSDQRRSGGCSQIHENVPKDSMNMDEFFDSMKFLITAFNEDDELSSEGMIKTLDTICKVCLLCEV